MYVFDTQEWSRDEKYQSFWSHYEASEKWRRHHYKNISRENVQHPSTSNGTRSRTTSKNNRKRRPILKLENEPEQEVVVKNQENGKIYDDNEENVVEKDESEEISEEMKEFMEKTKKHRIERDAKRAKEANEAERKKHWLDDGAEDYVDVNKISIRGRKEKTSHHKDEQAAVIKRRENAQKLYGKASQKILAMETVLEMQFERVYADKNAQLWPNIPLKF